MKIMKPTWMIAALTVGILGYGSSASAADIKIGMSAALTGPAASVGVDIKRGAEIAINEINEAGGVNGNKLKLVARDDEHNPVKTVAQYRELVEREGVVAMLGASNSASMLAVAPIVNDLLKVPVICPATDATAITENQAAKDGRDNYIFRVGMYGEGQANFMVDTAVKKFGFNKVGLLNWTAGWGVTGRDELIRRLKEHGLTPVADETFDSSDTDMTPQLLKLRDAGAEVILNYGLVRENTFVARSREQLNIDIPYISAWGIAGPAFSTAAGPSANGILTSTTVTIDGPQNERRQKFIQAYKEAYKEDMGGPVYALGAYDSIYLIKEAIESKGSKPGEIREGLENIPTFDGIIKKFDRPVFTKDRHNAITEDDMLMTRWTDGKLLKIEYDESGPFVTLESNEKKYINVTDMSLK